MTRRGEFYPLNGREVGRLARFLAAAGSPLESFNFVDRQTEEQVFPDFDTLQTIAYAKWEENSKEELIGVVYTIDAIIGEVIKTYDITPKERRSEERRSGERRS
jgi:hypothetical protein